MTQRLVPGVGKSAIVNGLPSGPTTYMVVDRRDSITNTLSRLTEQLGAILRAAPLKFSYVQQINWKYAEKAGSFVEALNPIATTCAARVV